MCKLRMYAVSVEPNINLRILYSPIIIYFHTYIKQNNVMLELFTIVYFDCKEHTIVYFNSVLTYFLRTSF